MKNEKMLEHVNEFIRLCNMGCTPLPELLNLKAQLEKDVMLDTAKSAGKLSVTKAAARICKSATLDRYKGKFIDDQGFECVISGYHGVRFYNGINIPEAPQGDGKPIDMERMIKPLRDYTNKIENVPPVGELKASLKVWKAAHPKYKFRPTFDFGDGQPLVDVQYLIDVLEAMPGCEIYTGAVNSILYFKSEDGEGLLCPVHKAKIDAETIVNVA